MISEPTWQFLIQLGIINLAGVALGCSVMRFVQFLRERKS